jgi:hypothetical protein
MQRATDIIFRAVGGLLSLHLRGYQVPEQRKRRQHQFCCKVVWVSRLLAVQCRAQQLVVAVCSRPLSVRLVRLLTHPWFVLLPAGLCVHQHVCDMCVCSRLLW